ncbi:MAG: class I SAM-dependent methyltransferase [Cyclobacteriaceae bacterium]
MKRKLYRKCPICEFEEGEILHNQKFLLPDQHPLRNGYEVVLCDRCNFLFADSAVTQSDYDIYYSDFSKYEDNHTSTGGGEAGFDSKRLENVAQEIASIVEDKSLRVLDVGCANGGILKRLKQLGHTNIVGVDPSRVCVEYVKRELQLEAYEASLFNMPDSIGKFDLIILSHVLEHILNLNECLEVITKFLNNEGRVYIEVPDAMRYVSFITSPFQDFNTEHINHFTKTSLDNLFTNRSFVKLKGGAKTIESAANMPYPAIYAFYRSSSISNKETYQPDSEIKACIMDYIISSQKIIDRIDAHLKAELSRGENILVWGTGQLTMKLLAISTLGDLPIINFVDSNPILRGKKLMNKLILHPSQLSGVSRETKVLITSTIHEDEIKKDMIELYKLSNPIISLRNCLN